MDDQTSRPLLLPPAPMPRRAFLRAAGLGTAGWVSGRWMGLRARAASVPLLIRGGTVVTVDRRFAADVRVRDGKIAEVGPNLAMRADGERVVDAHGLFVLPGGIDPHVHLPGGADDLTSGSAAAIAGGITTLGNMVSPASGETLAQAIDRMSRLVAEQAIADFFLHPVVREVVETTFQDLAHLFAAGHTSVKIHTISPNFDRQARDFFKLVQQAGQAGALTLIHCEDYAIVSETTESLMSQGKSSAAYLPDSRPVIAEVVATYRAMAICQQTAAPVYIVHLSSERALQVCREARARGMRAYVETRPTYLHLTQELYKRPDPGLYVAWPPLRESSDVQALWRGLKEGEVHTIGSDHSAAKRAEKLDPSLTLRNYRPGFSNMDVMLPMLYSEGVAQGRISLEQFVAVTSTNSAKLFGLYPHKGSIAVGSDADLAVWDPAAKHTLRQADLQSRADFLVYEGVEVTGWPRITIRRGEVVYEAGQVTASPGSGQLLRRGKTQAL